MQTQTSNTLHNAIMEADSKDRPPMLAPDMEVLISKGSPDTTTKSQMETYNTVSQDIRDQLNAKAEAKAIERLKQGESISVQDLETNLYWEFRKFTSHDGESLELYYSMFYKMMNELIRNHCDVTNHQVNVQFLLQLQPEWQRNRGKAIVNSPQPIYDQEPSMVAEDDETSKDKEIDKLMALISLSFKKLYKPTNNNLRTSSNISRANQDNSPRINRSTGYENQRIGNVARARETVARECQKLKRVKDAAYHREKMLLCMQDEAGIQLNAEQADWRDDTDDELEDQEIEAHYMYMAQLQEVSPDVAESGPIFDVEPLQKVSYDDHYTMFAIESEHPEQSESVHDTYPIEQDAHNMEIKCAQVRGDFLSYKMESQKSFNKYTQTINDLNQTIPEMKNKLSAHQETISILSQQKEAQIKLYKTCKDKELDKVIALENKVKVLDNIVYKTGQSVQMMNMLNNKCRTSFAKPEFLKKAQRANPRLSQLETQKTQFLNEIDRLSKEYYYADHMNAILGVYTELDEVTNLQCDYLELLEKCEYLENKLSNSKMMSKSFEALQKQAINPEIDLQQCKPTIFSNSLERNDFSKSKSVTQNNMSNDLSKPVIAQTLPPNKKSIIKNMNVLAPGMYKLHTKLTQTRTSQLPQDSRKTNKRVSFSTGVIMTTSVSRPQLKSNPTGDRVMRKNSQGKKQKVEDQHRNVKLSKNKTSVTAYLVQGAVTLKRVYYVEGLNHKLFSVSQFCDADLEVAFWKSRCYIRDLNGNDLLIVIAQTLPPNKKSIIKNMNVLAPGMYKLHTKLTQTRTSQLPQDSRKTNKRVSFSTGVIMTTSVSRPQLKSNPTGDRVMRKNSQGKKQKVEDQHRNVKLSKNKTSVTACNDSL
nr:integrase, catalytic region, zinc finger, CCHC-type, peptidase aspartic, catalytic [Tanacetum cinerariifolium]